MIARVWHGYTRPEHADAYEALLKPELLPGISKVKGYRGSYLLRRAVETKWSSLPLFSGTLSMQSAPLPDRTTKLL